MSLAVPYGKHAFWEQNENDPKQILVPFNSVMNTRPEKKSCFGIKPTVDLRCCNMQSLKNYPLQDLELEMELWLFSFLT